ncbi:MAG: hypothetical protein M3N51_01250 [Actinomycetota bacterium]|nr:hypothetical protein [Actinomycetota bacterium]
MEVAPRHSRPGRHRAAAGWSPEQTVRGLEDLVVRLLALLERLVAAGEHLTRRAIDDLQAAVRQASPHLRRSRDRLEQALAQADLLMRPGGRRLAAGLEEIIRRAFASAGERLRRIGDRIPYLFARYYPGHEEPPAAARPAFSQDLPPQRPPRMPDPGGIDSSLSWEASPEEGSYELPVLEFLGLAEPEVEYASASQVLTLPARRTELRQNGASRPPRPSELWERLPTLSDVAEEDEEDVDTGRLIQRLWEAGSRADTQEAAEEWTPQAAPAPAAVPRSFRWSVLILAVLLAVGAFVLLLAATRIPQSRAEEVASRYAGAVDEMQEVLPQAREAGRLITDPKVPVAQLSGVARPLAQLEARALELSLLARQPLPHPPPLASDVPIQALSPARNRLQQAADGALAAQERLTNALNYRLLLQGAFRLPALPLSATSGEIDELRVALAMALADTLEVIDQLPQDGMLAEHRAGLQGLAERLESWQASYLEALRREDVDRATTLVARMEQAITSARNDLAGPLGRIRQAVGEQFDDTESLLDQAEIVLGSRQPN